MSYPEKLSLVIDTEETLYLKDKQDNYYALNYWYVEKSFFRDFAGVQPEQTYLDEDRDVCYEYDDDSWELDTDVLLLYIDDYISNKHTIYDEYYGDCRDEDIFRVEKDDEWYEDMKENLKQKECQKIK